MMIDMYKDKITDIKNGERIEILENSKCHICGITAYPILIDDTTIKYMNYDDYFKFQKSNDYKGILTKEDITGCSCSSLILNKKLVSKIEVKTGKLIFQNFFRKDEIRECPDQYKHGEISSLLGRNGLMQYLATKNIGYGQMTNTSVDVYSNEKDEILIIHCWLESYLDEKSYFKDHPEEIDENYKKQTKKAEKCLQYITDGQFEKIGGICCDMWRWMCADKSVLDLHKEEEDKDQKRVIANVEPGIWEIEHYFDFCEEDDFICSKLKRIS